ncbi:MAG: TetR/AcrR family transcriptional regulator [Casimicrobiaceae bacterium]|nr:TetR/AcrR family transcriptional regulator [Casimicrobiaceae bacterium]
MIPPRLPRLADLAPDAPVRERVLTAALELLQTDGFAGLTTSAVARRAGIRQSHLTYYFPTRAQLVRATAQFGVEAVLTPIVGAALGGELTLEQYKALLLPSLQDRGWCRLIHEMGSACCEDPSIRDWLVRFDESIRARIREGFRALGVPASDEDILVLHMSYIGALQIDMLCASEASLELARRGVAHAIDTLIEAIRARQRSLVRAPKPRIRARTRPPSLGASHAR